MKVLIIHIFIRLPVLKHDLSHKQNVRCVCTGRCITQSCTPKVVGRSALCYFQTIMPLIVVYNHWCS
jgi:hypothetical protein